MLIVLYDNSGVLVSSHKDLERLKDVRFEKLNETHVSWNVTLGPDDVATFLSFKKGAVAQGPGSSKAIVTEVKEGQFLYCKDPKRNNEGIIFGSRLGMLRHLDLEENYETEAVKLLVNQLVRGELRPELYRYLFHLREVQLKEVLISFDGAKVDSLSDASSHLYQFGNGPILYQHTAYGFCRLFKNIEQFKGYRTHMNQSIEDPEWVLQRLLGEYGQSFPNHVEKLTDRLSKGLDLDSLVLDGTHASIHELREVLFWHPEGSIDESLILPLIAYLGEVIRVQKSGDWKMEFNEESQFWTPVIIDQENHRYRLSADTLNVLITGKMQNANLFQAFKDSDTQ